MRDSIGPRPWIGIGAGLTGVAVLTLLLAPIRDHFTPAAPATLLIGPVVIAAIVGGWPALLVTAIVATGALTFAFVPPLNSFQVRDDALAVPAFLMMGIAVGAIVISEVHQRRLAEERTRTALLEEAERQRAALLRSVSHDLRTPLTAISAASAELRAGLVRDETTRAELLAMIGDQARRLDRLVANLLDLSRIEAGALRPDLRPIALDEVINDRVESLAGFCRDVTVRVDAPASLPLVAADYSQVGQVVSNLVENALRHSPRGGTVHVTATDQGREVEVAVADEGKGVGAEDMVAIFEPFHTGHGSGSTGIGLAICRAVVEAHHGSIWVTTGAPRGAVFHFTVPVSDE
jgi:K+-sensing histidine kinase KdpD